MLTEKKNKFANLRFGFLFTLGDPPPGLAKDHTFSGFFLAYSPNQDRFQYSLNGNEPNHHFQNRFDFYSDRTDLISIRFEQNRNQIVSENGGF